MVALNLRVAMHNTLLMAPYASPDNTAAPSYEWLIVERSGVDGEVLTISDAGPAPSTAPADAPAGLTPNNTMYGILLHENAIDNDATFLLVRHLPPGVTVPGSFFPADGYARIWDKCQPLKLRAAGRHAHDSGVDVPDPAPGEGMSWHFIGKRVHWANEAYVKSWWFFFCLCHWLWPCYWWWWWRYRKLQLKIPVRTPLEPFTPDLKLMRRTGELEK